MQYLTYLIFIVQIFYSSLIIAIDLNVYEGDEYWQKIDSLNWINGPANINHINQGTISINENQSALIGEDAIQIMYWINGLQYDIDIFVSNIDDGSYTDYTYKDDGYVKLDDWKDISPDDFIKNLRSGLKEENKEREERGFNTVTTIDWLRQPTLNREKNTVSYATSLLFSDQRYSVNAALLILGRYGYVEATYVTGQEAFLQNGNQALDSIIANYNFVPEKEYSKFTTGDKVAAAGIGALLASSLGVKAFKAGGLAALLLILKKAWFIILIPIIFVFSFIKRLFSRKQ